MGGAGKLLLNLSECIDKSKFEFIYTLPNNSLLHSKLEKQGRVFVFKGPGDKSFSIRSIFSLYRIIKINAPDIIHTHSAFSARIAARICGIPKSHIVYTKHCVFDCKNNISSIFRVFLNKVSDHIFTGKIIAVAEAAKHELLRMRCTPKKITVIINGSLHQKQTTAEEKEALKKHLGISECDFVIGIIARLEEYKDHKTFLKAAQFLLEENKNFKFLLIGNGSKREDLEKYAMELGIADHVIFTGYIEDVYRYLNILDLNVNCSIGTETSSLSISEGLSIGIPAIVSDFGGNPNMVINGATGMVYPQKNAYELYKIIYSLKRTPNVLKKMQKNAELDFQKRFSAKNMATQYEELYIKMLNKY